jgi:hypothetical protein
MNDRAIQFRVPLSNRGNASFGYESTEPYHCVSGLQKLLCIVIHFTWCERSYHQYGAGSAQECGMQKGTDPLTILTAVGVAGYVALMLSYVAQVNFGLSIGQVRFVSILAATLVALGIAVDFVGKHLTRPE